MERSFNSFDSLGFIKENLNAKVLILGIGDTLRSDDGVGSLLARRLEGRTPYIVYDSNLSPENYLGKIVKDKPQIVLLVDAVDFGGRPGEFRVFESGDIVSPQFFSTHNASLSLVIDYLKANLVARIILLAVQPKVLDFGESLSTEVNKTLETLTGWFLNGKD
jgi:hydrogenase 3 maturation protease